MARFLRPGDVVELCDEGGEVAVELASKIERGQSSKDRFEEPLRLHDEIKLRSTIV